MFATASFRGALREVAPALSRRYFSCQAPAALSSRNSLWSSTCLRSFARDFKNARVQGDIGSTNSRRGFRTSTRLLETLQATAQAGGKKSSAWPRTSSRTVAYWLLASAASVFGIVVFGGLTRLTESGLSITEWKPVTGSLPPMSAEDWESEFAKYRASPEFLVLNSKMTLEEFKSIYWMEWIHRVWGRVVGVSFVLPAVYFIARGRVAKNMVPKLAGIAGLIGFQGFLGWWMVKSGLKDDFLSPDRKPGRDVPRVSQYRLAAHLGTAFVAYLSMLWCGLSILRTRSVLAKGKTRSREETKQMLVRLVRRFGNISRFRIAVAALLGLTFTTAMSGALVAGLDAGLIYNEFPYMGLGLTPPRSELFDAFYSHDPSPEKKDLIWRNFLENPSLVQLDHRILATTTFVAVHALWAWTKFSKSLQKELPRTAIRGVHGVLGFVWLQVILGISTLIYMVPTPLASAHQAGALALLTWTTVLFSRVTVSKAAMEIMRQRAGLAAAQIAKSSSSVTGTTASRLTQGGAVLQAGVGSATAAALGSMLLAGTMQERREEQRVVERKAVNADKLAFLRTQQHGISIPQSRPL